MQKTVMSAVTDAELLETTTEIVSAYVMNNPLPAGDLPDLIESVHKALAKIADKDEEREPTPF